MKRNSFDLPNSSFDLPNSWWWQLPRNQNGSTNMFLNKSLIHSSRPRKQISYFHLCVRLHQFVHKVSHLILVIFRIRSRFLSIYSTILIFVFLFCFCLPGAKDYVSYRCARNLLKSLRAFPIDLVKYPEFYI